MIAPRSRATSRSRAKWGCRAARVALIAAVSFNVVSLNLVSLHADSKKTVEDQRMEIMRGLSSEYATVKSPLPRSKKPLEFDATHGTWDKQKWEEAGKELGPAARIGDLVQVTHVQIDKDRLILEINHGMNGNGRGKWTDHIQVGIGVTTAPINGQPTNAPSGTYIAVLFEGSIGETTSSEVKKMLAPVLDFEKHSATENYAESLPPEVKKAIEDKKPMEGMDRDQVLLAMGRPVHKSRENKDGVEYEDWIYGEPPGRMTFVTFAGPKVVRIKETYAGLGGTIAETPSQP